MCNYKYVWDVSNRLRIILSSFLVPKKKSEQFKCVEKNRFPKTSYKGIICIKLNISRLKQKTYFKRPNMQTE